MIPVSRSEKSFVLFNTCTRKIVSDKVFDAKARLHVQWRLRSFAASVPGDESKTQRPRKKVPIVERRTMVESFVNRYREAHAGRFPSSSATLRQVGGSYYVVRKILQELEYECKTSSSKGGKQMCKVKDVTKDGERSVKHENVLLEETVDKRVHDLQHPVSISDLELTAGTEYSTRKERKRNSEESHLDLKATEKGLPGSVGKDRFAPHPHVLEDRQVEEVDGNHLDVFVADRNPKRNKESEDHLHKTDINDSGKEQAATEELPDIDVTKFKEEPFETDKYASYTSRQTDDAERQTDNAETQRTSIWRTLKSITDNFINMWRKP